MANVVEIVLRVLDDASGKITTIGGEFQALGARVEGIAASAEKGAAGTNSALAKISTKVPEGEIARLSALVAQLPQEAVKAAGGAEVALNRIYAAEAKVNLKALDTAIAALPKTGELAARETSAALDGIKATGAAVAIGSLKREMGTIPAAATKAAVETNGALEAMSFEGALSKVHAFRDSLLELGKRGAEAIGLIGIAEGGLDFAALKQAAGFQTAVTQARNNTLMTDSDQSAMRRSVLTMAPQLGIAPSELVGGYRQAFDLNNNAAVTDVIMRIGGEAAASTGDKPEADMSILAQLLHDSGLDRGGPNQEIDATRLMGQAHIAAAASKMTLPDFSQNFGQINAWAQSLGVPVDQVMADFATMAKHGFDPAEAATQVKDIFPHLIHPSAGALKFAGSLDQQLAKSGQDQAVPGEATTDAAGNKIGPIEGLFNPETLKNIGLAGIFDTLHTKFEALGMDEAQQTQAIMKLIPNIRGGAATFVTLGKGADDYKTILGQLNDQTLVMNVTHDAFVRTQDTLAFKWDVLKVKLEEQAIALGDRLMPKATQLLDWLTGQLPGAITNITGLWGTFTSALSGNWGDASGNSGLTSFVGTLGLTIHDQVIPAFLTLKDDAHAAFDALQRGTKFLQDHTFAAAALVTVLTGIGTAMLIYKAAQIATEAWTAAQWLLNIAMDANPVGLIVIAVAALAAGFIYAYTHSEKFRSIINQIGTISKEVAIWIKDALGKSMQWLGDQFNNLGVTANRLKEWFGAIFGPGGSIGSFFDDFGSKVHDVVTGVGSFFDDLGTKAHDIEQAFAWFVDQVKFHMGAFLDNCTTPINAVGAAFDWLGTKAHNLYDATIGKVFGKGGLIGTAFSDLGSVASDWFAPGGKIGSFFENVGTKAHQLYDATIVAVFGRGGLIGTAFSDLGSIASEWFAPGGKIGQFFDNVGTKAHELYDATIGKVFGKGGLIGTAFSDLGSVASDWFSPGGKIGDWFAKLGTAANTLKSDLTTAFGNLEDFLRGWGGRIANLVLTPFHGIAKGLDGLIQGIGTGVNWVAGLFDFNKVDFGGIPKIDAMIPQFATGLNWQGGMAVVGEKGPEAGFGFGGNGMTVLGARGPEIRYVPRDATIVPHEESTQLGLLPGFFLGLNADDIKSKVGQIAGTVADVFGKGIDWVVSHAMDLIGGVPKISPFDGLGTKLIDDAKKGITDFVTGVFKDHDALPHDGKSGPPGGGSSGTGYQGGSAVLDMAMQTPGQYMWCEKFVGDVMQRLGYEYWRAPTAEAHAHAQPLNPGTGPAGAIVFYPWQDVGHVNFSGGDGSTFGTVPEGTGWRGPGAFGTPYGWTMTPYANGGWLTEPVIGRGASGQLYSFAERGPERIRNTQQEAALGTGGVHVGTISVALTVGGGNAKTIGQQLGAGLKEILGGTVIVTAARAGGMTG